MNEPQWRVVINCANREHAEALLGWLDTAAGADWPWPDPQLERIDP